MKILDPEQIANILGPGWDAIASLPHLVTDLDCEKGDVKRGT